MDDAGADGIDLRRGLTHRLIRYIENEAPRRPRSAIAATVGISDDQVRRIILDLSNRLAKHHRFPTPRVLGVDDIKLGGKIFHLFTDAERGHAVGLVAAADGEALEAWASANLHPATVQVIVSDLGPALLKLGASPTFAHAVHVADRWHILQGCQKAMGRVIAQEIAKLDVQPRPRSAGSSAPTISHSASDNPIRSPNAASKWQR